MGKYKLTWKDLTLRDFKIYLFAMFKAFIPKRKIKNLDDLEEFIQTKSAWVTQVTLYNYLKTRMGTRYVLHFENDVFMGSVNLAKWNIYSVSLQDLTFFTFSYLNVNFNFQEISKAREIFNKILDDEISNKMPLDIIETARKSFDERLEKLSKKNNWNYLSTRSFFCNNEKCLTKVMGETLYFDEYHLTQEGMMMYHESLKKNIQKLTK